MPEDNTLQTLHATVLCYLKTVQSVADALGEACPAVGGPYRQRLSRLRARLAFESTAAAIEESSAVVSQEVKEYAKKASSYVEQHRLELRQAISGLEGIARTIAQRQDFYAERLRQFATQIENAPHSPDSGNVAENVASQAAGLLSCVESMSHESQSLLKKMRDEMARVELRLADAEITDPVTGLLNRRGMEQCIEAAQTRSEASSLVLFEFPGDLPGEVAQQVGARLSSQFRHNDLISRWGDREFLVLFQGDAAMAALRAEQVAPWIAGRYLLDTGATMETAVEARLVEAPLADLVSADF